MAGPPGSPAFVTEKEKEKKSKKTCTGNKDKVYNKARKRENKKNTYFHK